MEKREIFVILVAAVLMSLIIIFHEKSIDFISPFVISAIILLIFITSKKITASVIDLKIEHNLWVFQRWWLGKGAHFRKPFPIGAVLPLLLSLISNGVVTCFSFMQFDSKALPGKAVKKYGTKRFSEISEFDLAMVVFYGILSILVLSILSKFFLQGISFLGLNLLSKYALYFAIWNMIPLSQLDGTKLFFGSSRLYFFTLILLVVSIFIFVI